MTRRKSTAITRIACDAAGVQVVSISSLLRSDSPRLEGEDSEHAKILAQTGGSFPPILVHRPTMRVIDGMHRLNAARLRGAGEIAVRFFDGDAQAAFVLAVESNIAHGLPLTLADRTAAAARILADNTLWSDRAIGVKTGLAAATVAGVRQRSGSEPARSAARVGRDGRLRPLNHASGRRLASALITERPDVTLREISRYAGIAVSTAHDVRSRLGRGEDPVPATQREAEQKVGEAYRPESPNSPPCVPEVTRPEPAAILERMQRDPALRYNDKGRVLLRWLASHVLSLGQWREFSDGVPPHCMKDIAEFARGSADMWTSFGEELARRP